MEVGTSVLIKNGAPHKHAGKIGIIVEVYQSNKMYKLRLLDEPHIQTVAFFEQVEKKSS